MAILETYSTLAEKRPFFSNGDKSSFVIETREDLDKWFKDVVDAEEKGTETDATALIYRGLTEAKYKLYTSSQRIWIENEMPQWANKTYLGLISTLVKNANLNPIIKRVFDIYNYSDKDREFPILALLQHYGAPTPLMDWTYNNNVAFFFATERLTKKSDAQIDNYFAIYRINKAKYRNELLNIIDALPDKLNRGYPPVEVFEKIIGDSADLEGNGVFYISDFEERGSSTDQRKAFKKLMIRLRKPMTSVYNQNIIPQEGLFIFNPYSNKTLEEIFNPKLDEEGWNFQLTPFDCFNINKDLGDYLRRKIDVRYNINSSFIYPQLVDEAKKIKERTLNNLV